ncbi:hypothetical protein EYF80_007838 [Liparis tanakae]|uniref:Uncharacterized protein n=1 Tax=Liparis tanakae TaxID=230148 RepID=A0A4Z2IVF2_9TELE|nr:hypothetical protein EYF80_007838 [Liparis tanakae]
MFSSVGRALAVRFTRTENRDTARLSSRRDEPDGGPRKRGQKLWAHSPGEQLGHTVQTEGERGKARSQCQHSKYKFKHQPANLFPIETCQTELKISGRVCLLKGSRWAVSMHRAGVGLISTVSMGQSALLDFDLRSHGKRSHADMMANKKRVLVSVSTGATLPQPNENWLSMEKQESRVYIVAGVKGPTGDWTSVHVLRLHPTCQGPNTILVLQCDKSDPEPVIPPPPRNSQA